MPTTSTLIPRGRQDAGEERRHGEHACALAQLVLVHFGHGGGIVAADEVVRPFVRVDRWGDDDLMPAAVVGGLQGDDLRAIQSFEGVEPQARRTIDVVRGLLAALGAAQRIRKKPRRKLHSLAPVVVYGADPSRSLSALPADTAATPDVPLHVFERDIRGLPFAVYRLSGAAVEAYKLDALVGVVANQVGVSACGATHRCAPGDCPVESRYILLRAVGG